MDEEPGQQTTNNTNDTSNTSQQAPEVIVTEDGKKFTLSPEAVVTEDGRQFPVAPPQEVPVSSEAAAADIGLSLIMT